MVPRSSLPDEVTFDSSTFLTTKERAKQAKAPPEVSKPPEIEPVDQPPPIPDPTPAPPGGQQPLQAPQKATLRLTGTVPPESWNMVGVRILSKLRSGEELNLSVNLSVQVDSTMLQSLEADIRQALVDLKLEDQVKIE